MDVRIVDTEVVRQNIKNLKTLKKECQQEREKKLGEFSADQGEVHDELEKACQILDDTWKQFIELIDRTIQFLTQGSESYDKSDQASAKDIKR